MKECQNIEWKESWSDEYLKWICGFANAQGGKLYIGVNDSEKVVGVANAKKLLEDIPNKIVTTLGIVAEVNLRSKDGTILRSWCHRLLCRSHITASITIVPAAPDRNSRGPRFSSSFSAKWDCHGTMSCRNGRRWR